MTPPPIRKKLIEVALPLQAINTAAMKEKGNPFLKGHPRSLHQWWARRPLATARAVIFSQMVDDPSSNPDLFPTESKQKKERQRLFRIIEELVLWENAANESIMQRAREEIWQSWRRSCAQNVSHPNAKEIFDRYKLPAFHDPFAGGGALPLEAQRLGLETYASDLNPVAVLINKAMIEVSAKFSNRPPANPDSGIGQLGTKTWRGAQGLAEDVRYYSRWLRDEAEKRIGHFYPQVEITATMASARPDLKMLVGQKLTVTTWLWARTVKSPNPAFRETDVPLASNFMLSDEPGKRVWIEPVAEGNGYKFTVRIGEPTNGDTIKLGTKLSGSGSSFSCLKSGTPIPFDYVRAEGKAGRIGIRLMAMVADSKQGRVYLSPSAEAEIKANEAHSINPPRFRIACQSPRISSARVWHDQMARPFYASSITNSDYPV